MTTELWHITERAHWEAARRTGVYEQSTRGRTLAEEGYIHCSLPHQLAPVAQALYGTRPEEDPVVLVINVSRTTVHRWLKEMIDLLAARAPRLERVLAKITREGGSVVLLDGR
ncbi:DUF952 domain-containing protein [Streptomyces phytophilus]|uniref:DUF952 domain-containing protein n=1 Tax=Streptomyces phytophilus TaxID=722715 RepID=UPI0015F0066F|nr:DUF952 domain-containing protein [Streptomyces phytophilus]